MACGATLKLTPLKIYVTMTMTSKTSNQKRDVLIAFVGIVLLLSSVTVLSAVTISGAGAQEINVTDPTAEEPTPEVYDKIGPITIRTVETTADNTLRVKVENTGEISQRIGIVQVPSNSDTILWDSTRILSGEEVILTFDLVSNPNSDRPVAYVDTGEPRIPTVALVPPSNADTIPLREGVFLGSAVALLAVGLAARRRVEETGEPEIEK